MNAKLVERLGIDRHPPGVVLLGVLIDQCLAGDLDDAAIDQDLAMVEVDVGPHLIVRAAIRGPSCSTGCGFEFARPARRT